MGNKKSKPKKKKRKSCSWTNKNRVCSTQLSSIVIKINSEKKKKNMILSKLRPLRNKVGKLEKNYNNKMDTRNKIKGMYASLKSVCLTSEDNSKKSKKRLMNTLSGRYIDRINLIEAQKNVLNKQAILLSNKTNKFQKNTNKLDEMRDNLETKTRNVLISKRGSDDNTRIIWFLKIVSYVVCILLVTLIMTKM